MFIAVINMYYILHWVVEKYSQLYSGYVISVQSSIESLEYTFTWLYKFPCFKHYLIVKNK